MKIEIEIDDKYAERKILILAGVELVAFKNPGDNFIYVKTTSCNKCGECCMDEPITHFGNDDEGKCNMLVQNGPEWECGAGDKRPWCCLDDPKGYPTCSIKHKIVWVK